MTNRDSLSKKIDRIIRILKNFKYEKNKNQNLSCIRCKINLLIVLSYMIKKFISINITVKLLKKILANKSF